MEEQNKEITVSASQTAEAEKITGDKSAEVSLGKFKDVESLLKAYNCLQSEFTKRCQRIKELEGTVAEKTPENTEIPAQTEGEKSPDNGITEDEKKDFLKEYLKSVVFSKQKAVLIDGEGVSVKTPTDRPKNVTEAGKLAKLLF